MKKLILLFFTHFIFLAGCGQFGGANNNTTDQVLLTEIGTALPGYQVTFASGSGLGGSDIWVVNANGSGERNLTGKLGGGSDLYPEWGPNAEYIYYTSNKHGGALELYRVNTVGEPQPQQVTLLRREVRSISVSADNQLVALGVMTGDVPLGSDLKPFSADMYLLDLAVLDAALANNRLVTLNDMQLLLAEPADQHIWHEQPDWARHTLDESNQLLAYARTENYDNDPVMKDEIWLVRADGSEHTRLLENDSMPRWSVDGTLIATHQFNIIDVTMRTVRRLQIDGLADDAGAASISPDNQFVLFESDDRNRQAGVARLIYADEANGQANPFTLLLERPAFEPRWSPVPVPTN